MGRGSQRQNSIAGPRKGLAALMFFCLGVASIPLRALAGHQPVGSSEAIVRLEDLIGEALDKNAALKASLASDAAKEAAISQAGSLEDPELAFEAKNYSLRSGGPTDMREREVSLSQRLPLPGKRRLLEDASRSNLESQREQTRDARASIILKVKTAFYELYLQYKALSVLDEQQNIIRSLLATSRRQYSAGKASQAEVLNLQLEEAAGIGKRLTLESKVKAAQGEINHLLGRREHGQYLAGRPEEVKKTPFQFDGSSEEEILRRATASNPKVASRRAMLAASDAKLAFSNLNLWPDLNVKAAYTFREPTTEYSNRDTASAMVGVTLPLWAGSRQSPEKRQSTSEKLQAEALLEEEQIDLAHHIHVTYAELQEAASRLKLFDEALIPLSKQALSSAQSGYLTGKVDFSSLLGLITKRSQVALDYVETLVTFEVKIAELEYLTGNSIEGTKE